MIQLGRDYDGTDLRWTTEGGAASQRWSLTSGLAYDKLREHRYGFLNDTGTGADQVLGVLGALRRNLVNDVQDLDPYLQGEWHPAQAWTLDAGVRRSNVRFVSHDEHVIGTNPSGSGKADYSATLPVLGVLYALRPDVHLYVTAGRGFETPTLNELAYRPSGLTGLNLSNTGGVPRTRTWPRPAASGWSSPGRSSCPPTSACRRPTRCWTRATPMPSSPAPPRHARRR